MRTLLESVWGAVQIGVHIVLGPVLHRWRTRWGTVPEERHLVLPGDDIVPHPTWTYNHAITIDAPRSRVWPWLAQLGQGRGGFYSYEGLERIVGCGIRNVDVLRPELQQIREGDVIRMHRTGYGPTVMLVQPERSLVLGGLPDERGSQFGWSFHLFHGARGTTRLLERGRNRPGRGMLAKLLGGPYLLDPIGFVMSRKMLRTIKRLAEGTSGAPPPTGLGGEMDCA